MTSSGASPPVDIESADTVLEPGELSGRSVALEAYEHGTQVGPFTIVGQLGEGGMGIVYSAYDPRLDRKVALKLLRPDHGGERTSQGRRRLLREAQALAKLSHENVVVVHETGEFEGQIFVAMEYVEGGTLRDWERAQDRSWQDVVAIYCRAGRGLLAAHVAGMVHRDFKPDNVLVGNDGRVRVTDFGLVRGTATQAEAEAPDERRARFPTAVPLSGNLTRHSQVVGTPGYVAPELYHGDPADARSDQYAFCVSLYEALYDEKPFVGDNLAEIALSQCKNRLKPPPTDSEVPARILEVVQRGYSMEPGDRFDSMADLLNALAPRAERAVSRAVLAVGASIAVAIAGLAVVLLLRGGSATHPSCTNVGQDLDRVWNADRRARVAAALNTNKSALRRDTTSRVLGRLEDYAGAWKTARRQTCEATRVHHTQSERALDLRMACLDRRLGALDSVARTLTRGDDRTARNAVLLTAALPDVKVCADLSRLESRTAVPVDPRLARKVTGLQQRLYDVNIVARAGDTRTALKQSADNLASARALSWPRTLAMALQARANLLDNMGKHSAARKLFAEALPLAGKARDDELVATLHIDLLGSLRYDKTNLERVTTMKPIVEAAVSRAGDTPTLRVKYLRYVAGAYDKAGKYDAALKLYRRAMVLAQRALGPRDPLTARATNDVAVVLDIQGKTKQAIAIYERVLRIERELFGKHHPRVARALNNLAVALVASGDNQGGERRYRRALKIWKQTFGPKHPMVGVTQLNLGVVLAEQKHWREAEKAYRGAIASWQDATGETRAYLATALNNLGDLFEQQGQCGKATPNYTRALQVWQATLGKQHPDLAYALLGLGNCRIATKQPQKAIALLQRALRLREKASVDADDIAEVQFALARALVAANKNREHARRLAQKALARYARSNAGKGSKAAAVRTWLAHHH